MTDGVTLRNKILEAHILSYGASLCALRLKAVPYSLVLGYARPEDFEHHSGHFGAIAGPVANRISSGRAQLGAKVLILETNENGMNTLHGGSLGTGRRHWVISERTDTSVKLTLSLPDQTLGFPGPLHLSCTYTITDDACLILTMRADAEQNTLCNLASHPYFCLDNTGDIRHHSLMITADHYLPVTDAKIPTGLIEPVADTSFDYRSPRRLAAIIEEKESPVDHCFCWEDRDNLDTKALYEQARLTSQASAIGLTVLSNQPGLQFYTGHGIQPGITGHDNRRYGPFSGLCLEPQKFPDAPNHPHFPSIEIGPDRAYYQRVCYRFSHSSFQEA